MASPEGVHGSSMPQAGMCNLCVQLRAGNRDMHGLRLWDTPQAATRSRVSPKLSKSRPSDVVGKTAEAAPGCLSVTPLRGPGHRLGKLPRRSRDKPSSLGFSQWRGIFSSGLVAALPASCIGVSRPREAPAGRGKVTL